MLVKLTTKIGENPQNISIEFGTVSDSLGSDNAGSLQKNPLLAIGTVKLMTIGIAKTVNIKTKRKKLKLVLESAKSCIYVKLTCCTLDECDEKRDYFDFLHINLFFAFYS